MQGGSRTVWWEGAAGAQRLSRCRGRPGKKFGKVHSWLLNKNAGLGFRKSPNEPDVGTAVAGAASLVLHLSLCCDSESGHCREVESSPRCFL